MKAAAVYAVLIAIVLAVCGMAMHVTGLDNACTAAGGHLEGVFGQRCVTP